MCMFGPQLHAQVGDWNASIGQTCCTSATVAVSGGDATISRSMAAATAGADWSIFCACARNEQSGSEEYPSSTGNLAHASHSCTVQCLGHAAEIEMITMHFTGGDVSLTYAPPHWPARLVHSHASGRAAAVTRRGGRSGGCKGGGRAVCTC